jgi:uncharacterized membrane protein
MYLYNILALVVSILWASCVVVENHILKKINASSFMIFYSTIWIIAVYLFCFTRNYKTVCCDFKKLSLFDMFLILLYSSVFSVGAELFYLYVLKNHKSPNIASALSCTYPLFVILLLYIFFKESVSFIELIGILFVTIGIIILSRK